MDRITEALGEEGDGGALSEAYKEGKQACLEGKRRTACPYKRTKKEAPNAADWLTGYSDQANDEAVQALCEFRNNPSDDSARTMELAVMKSFGED